MAAAQDNDVGMVELLLKHKADPLKRDCSGHTALASVQRVAGKSSKKAPLYYDVIRLLQSQLHQRSSVRKVKADLVKPPGKTSLTSAKKPP